MTGEAFMLRLKVLLGVVMALLLVTPVLADTSINEKATEVGEAFKKAGREVGHGVKEAADKTSKEAKKAAHSTGGWFSNAGRKTGEVFREAGRGIRNFFTGKRE